MAEWQELARRPVRSVGHLMLCPACSPFRIDARGFLEHAVCENFDLLPSRKPLEAQQKSSCRCAHWQSSAGRAPGSAVRDVFHATCWSNEPQTTRLHRCPRSINKSCQVFLQAIDLNSLQVLLHFPGSFKSSHMSLWERHAM